MRKSIILFILLLLIIPNTFSVLDSEAQKIYSSKELIIEQTIVGGLTVSKLSKPLTWVEINFNYFPINYDHQEVLSESYVPNYDSKSDSEIIFKLKDVDKSFDVVLTYLIKTKNEYHEVNNKINFPLKNLDSDFDVYLKPTELIDITSEIKATASTIASGKTDLFEVSVDVANWVVNNIQYDLNTITQNSVKKASWVMKNKEGVCDELSILYVALMRSLGIPARFVTGISYSNSDLFASPWNPHAWTEVYFPDYGWVPFDLTYGQFGFIDASHIKFKSDFDVSNIATNYEWKGYDLDKAIIDIKNTKFSMNIKDFSGTVLQGFDVNLELTNTAVNIGSYNILKIHLKNQESHYISSLLNLAVPNDVKVESNNIPIFLKPNEEKTIYVLLEVNKNLDVNYVYTMPVVIYTSFGNSYDAEFRVSTKYDSVSLNQVNSYLEINSNDDSTDDLNINCNFEQDSVIVGNNLDLFCMVQNEGNTFFNDANFCMIYNDKKTCTKFNLMISESKSFDYKVSPNSLGNQKIDFELVRGEYNQKKTYGFIAVDNPLIEINDIVLPKFNLGDDLDLVVSISKKSLSNPSNVDLRVLINGNIYTWTISNVSSNTDFTIPFNSYLFKPNDNKIEVFLIWENEYGSQFNSEKELTFVIKDFSFMDKIKSFFYRLFN